MRESIAMLRSIVLILLTSLAVCSPIESQEQQESSVYSFWYDTGLFGAYIGQQYKSFDLSPPEVNFVSRQSCDQGYTFISPRGRSVPTPGPMVLDADGELVWMEDAWGQAMDLRVQQYKGQDYITFWRGSDNGWHGLGTYLMLNASYDVVYEIEAANGLEGDLHEFHIVGDAALITIYDVIPYDLSSIGGPKDGWIFDCLFQEIDIATGKMLFQWRASEYYKIEESFAEFRGHGGSEDDAWDWFHINAVDKDDLGNYYMSSRYMHTITCITPTGDIKWKLGGKHNDFQDLSQGGATNFSWQHHVSWHPGNILTIFNNAAYDHHVMDAERSSGLKIKLDVDQMTATLLQEYDNPDDALAHSQGSVQILPSGNVFVDWGHNSGYTEFSADGDVLCNAHFGATAFWGWGWVKSYRGFKAEWVGKPRTQPSIAVDRGFRTSTVYASWNGATEVEHWRLEKIDNAGKAEEKSSEIRTVAKKGFETGLGVADGLVRVVALDVDMQVLGTSEILSSITGTQPVELSTNDNVVEALDLPTDIGHLPFRFILAICFFISAAFVSWNLRSLFKIKRYTRLRAYR